MKRRRLCRLDEIEPGGSRGVAHDGGTGLATVFLVRQGDDLRAYRNQCPHTGVAMDWQPHRFLDADGAFIICAVHGARFRIDDGACISGPCAGDALQPVAVEIIEGEVYLVEAGQSLD